MRNRIFKNIEWWILIFSLLLCIVGFVALYSATQSSGFGDFKKQIISFIVSLCLMTILIFINYDILVKLSPIFYGISIILLIAVLFTKPINGARSWFNIGGFSLQPGEIAKIAVILFVSNVISKMRIQSRQKNK